MDNLSKADVALFTGGEDVTPSLYNQARGKFTQCNFIRDRREAELFGTCQDLGVMCLGICRGSQFLTVMSGGSLVQDVTGHIGPHEVFTKGGRMYMMSSTHHQMMDPWTPHLNKVRPKFNVIAWSEGRSKWYLDGENGDNKAFEERGIEPEIVWYPETQCLCIQPHPEIMDPNSKGVKYVQGLVREYLT